MASRYTLSPSVVTWTRLARRLERSHTNSSRRVTVTAPDEPRRDKLRVRVDRGPGPHVANAGIALHALGDVLRLRIDEAPNFVELEAACMADRANARS